MSFLRSLFTLILLFVTSFFIWTQLTYDEKYEFEQAQSAYLKGNLAKSKRILERIQHSLPTASYHLYLAYIARAEDDLPLSEAELGKAEAACSSQPTNTLLEVQLNLALNAYLRQDYAMIDSIVQEHASQFKSDRWMSLLVGISEYYVRQDFQDAGEHFRRALEAIPFNPWMNEALNAVFTQPWLRLHIARSDIETGNFLNARQTLERISSSESEISPDLTNLLLGLSYIKEAQSKPVVAATPYYKLAFSYLNRVPMNTNQYQKERESIVTNLVQAASNLINAGFYRDLKFFSTALESIGASDRIPDLSSALVTNAKSQLSTGDVSQVKSLVNQLDKLVTETRIRKELSDQLEARILDGLESGDTTHVNLYWELARTLSPEPGLRKDQILATTENRIVYLLHRDNNVLSKTNEHLKLWLAIQTTREARLALANKMLDQVQGTWNSFEGEGKANNVLKMIATIPSAQDQKNVQSSIRTLITNAWKEAATKSDIAKIQMLQDLAKQWNLSELTLSSSDGLRMIEKAEESIRNGHWNQAEQLLAWVLSIDDLKKEATALRATLAYLKADYQTAHRLFQELESETPEAAVAAYIATGSGEKLWSAIEDNKLGNEDFIRVGLARLTDDTDEAHNWFEQADNAEQEKALASIYVTAEKGRWGDVLELIPEAGDLSNLSSLKAIHLLASIELGRVDLSDQLAASIDPGTPSPELDISVPLRQFLKGAMAKYDPYWALAQYYMRVKGDTSAALDLMMQIADPSPTVRLKRSELLIKADLHVQAMADLKIAYGESANNTELLKLLLPVLATAMNGSDHHYEAAEYWEQYLELVPSDGEAHASYASALSDAHLHAKALDSLLEWRATKTLTPPMYRAYLNALAFTEHTDEVEEQAQIWLKQEPPLDIRLAMMDPLYVSGNLGAIDPILRTATEELAENKLSVEGIRYLFDFLICSGKYEQVEKLLADSPETESLLSSESLARYYYHTGKSEAALILCQNTDHSGLVRIRYALHKDAPERLKEELQALRTHRKDGFVNVSEPLQYTEHLLMLNKWLSRHDPSAQGYLKDELLEAYYVMDDLTLRHPDLPDGYRFLGDLKHLQGDLEAAEEAYKQAINLDPTHTEALLGLGNVKHDTEQPREAIEYLSKAVSYGRSNPITWEALGRAQLSIKDYFEARRAYESALELEPLNREVMITLGKVFIELKSPEEAKEVLERAIDLNPEDLDALKLLLACLNDQSLEDATRKGRDLRKEKAVLYQKIYEISPEEAKVLFSEYEGEPGTRAHQQELLVK